MTYTYADMERDAARWRLIEYLFLGDTPDGDSPEFAALITDTAYRHQLLATDFSRPQPTTLELIDELVAGYMRGDALVAMAAEKSP